MAISFKGAHFPPEVILMGVRWYLAYPLSTRHVEELMAERGVEVDHATINPTATLERVAQNCPRRITILRSPAMKEATFDVLINLCVKGSGHFRAFLYAKTQRLTFQRYARKFG